MDENRVLKMTPLGLAIFLIAFSISIFKIATFDIFWHLKIGELFFDTFSIINSNNYSWTFPEHPWIPTYWLFEALTFLVYSCFHFKGLIIFKALIIAITYERIFSMMVFYSKKGILSFLAVIAILELSFFRFMLRPHLFSFLGLAILLNILYGNKDIFSNKSIFWKLPLLFCLWVNLHSGVIYGVVLLLIFFLSTLINSFKNKEISTKTVLQNIILGLAVTFSALLLNPTGITFFSYLVDHLSLDLIIPLEEFAPITFKQHFKQIYILICIVFVPIVFLLRRKKLKTYHIMLLLISIFLLSKGVRFIPVVSIYAVPALIDSLAIFNLFKLKIFSQKRLVIGFLILCSLLYVGKIHLFSFNKANSVFKSGLGVNKDSFPVEICKKIDMGIDRGLYNSFSLGGYLTFIYDGKCKVFQDGRIHAYPLKFFNEIEEAKYDSVKWQNLIRDYGINSVFINKEEDSALMINYIKDIGWNVILEDDRFFVAKMDIDSRK